MEDYQFLTSFGSTSVDSSTSSPVNAGTQLNIHLLESSPFFSFPYFSTTQPGVLVERQLILTKIGILPCAVLLILSSALFFYLVLKHFTHLFKLYFSLLLYTAAQIFLVLVIFTSPLIQVLVAPSNPGRCQAVSLIENLANILPGYGVLFVSAAIWVCVSYPLKYKKILDLRIQVVVVGVVVCLLVLLTCLPLLGICRYSWKESEKLKSGGYCAIGPDILDADLPGQCLVFRWLLVGVGYILPFIGVLFIYILIIRVLVSHKQAERTIDKRKGNSCISHKLEYNYKPVNISEKLTLLRAIGQDAIPWYIIVILALNTFSSLLWIPQIFLRDVFFDTTLYNFLLLDITYFFMLIAISLSPLSFMLSAALMRNKLGEIVKCYAKNTSDPSGNAELSKPTDA